MKLEHETDCNRRPEIRDGTTRKQNTVNNLNGGTSGGQNPK